MTIRMAMALLAGILCATYSFAADVSGKWSGLVKLPNGLEVPLVAHLKQSGTAVTGTLEGINGAPDVVISDGKNDKDTISFNGVRPIQGADVKFHYTGRLSGNSMDVTIARADGQGAPLTTHTTRAAD